VSAFTNDAGYITGYTETDPVFSASAASGISSSDITSWNGMAPLDWVKTNNSADSNATLRDANAPTALFASANGWSEYATNYPAYFNNRYGFLITIPLYRGTNNFAGSMQLFGDVLGNIDCRRNDGTTWGDWKPVGGVLTLSVASFSSLPQTVSDSRIISDMVCLKAELGTPSAQTGDWTVTTSNGSVTISGSISGSTTATLYLARKE
jgi:hypothetical protein